MTELEPGRGRAVRLAATGTVASALAALAAGALAWHLGSLVAAGAALHLATGVPVWAAAWLLAQHRARARAAEREAARLLALAREGRRAIFEAEGGLDEDARQALARFERGGAPVFAALGALLSLGAAWLLVRLDPGALAAAPLAAAAGLSGGAFALLLLGRYAHALAREGDLEEAAAGARRAISGALAAFVAGAVLALAHVAEAPALDRLGLAFAAVEALLGLEALALLVLEAYRPRRAGERPRPVYDSRLLGLLAAPGDVARSIARAVDYQFGFSLSQTWFYRFVARWVLPIVAFGAACLWLASAVRVVHAHEVALVRRLGRLQADVRGPGLHLTLPWPLDEVVLVPVRRRHLLVTSEEGHDEAARLEEGERENVLLWTRTHFAHEHEDEDDAELLVLLPARGAAEDDPNDVPVNLVVTAAAVGYRVADAQAFAARVEDPHALLAVLTEREASLALSGSDLDELLATRGAQAARVEERLRAALARHGCGLEVDDVHLIEVHPPVEVGLAFESVTSALEQREAAVLAARADAARTGPRARAEAERLRAEAEVAARTRVLLLAADAERFAALRALDRAAPGVFRLERRLRALAQGARDARKVVLGPGAAGAVTDLNLQDKVTAEQLDLGAEVVGAPAQGAEGGE